MPCECVKCLVESMKIYKELKWEEKWRVQAAQYIQKLMSRYIHFSAPIFVHDEKKSARNPQKANKKLILRRPNCIGHWWQIWILSAYTVRPARHFACNAQKTCHPIFRQLLRLFFCSAVIKRANHWTATKSQPQKYDIDSHSECHLSHTKCIYFERLIIFDLRECSAANRNALRSWISIFR